MPSLSLPVVLRPHQFSLSPPVLFVPPSSQCVGEMLSAVRMKIAVAKCVGHRLRHFRFGQDKARLILSNLCLHLLLKGNRFSTPLFRLSPSDTRVCFGLIRLQASSDILADVDVRDVNRHNFKGCVSVQASIQDCS